MTLKNIPQAERLLSGTLTSYLSDVATTCVMSDPPSKFPTYIDLEPDSTTKKELIRAVAVSGSTVTIERSVNGVVTDHAANATYKQKITSRHWDAVSDALDKGYLMEDALRVLIRVSDTQFTITGYGASDDLTGTYTIGRVLRINSSASYVMTVTSSSYSAGTNKTTINVSATLPTPVSTVEFGIAPLGGTNLPLTSPVINTGFSGTAKASAAEVTTGTDDTKIVTPLAAAPYGNSSMSRQAIINGNFDVWQRGTSKANVNGIEILADRWKMYTASASEANTFSQADASDLSGSQYAAKWQRTAGQTGTVNFLLGQSLETKDSIKFRGKKVTLSFYAKAGANYSPTSGYLVSKIKTGTGTDGEVVAGFTGDAEAATQNNVLTTSWQRFTLTTSAVIAGSVNQIGILFADAVTGTAGAEDWFMITQVQLCAGDVALPFQPKNYTQELIDCQRYCVDMLGGSALANIIVATGECNSTTRLYASIQLPVTMRIAPTIVAGTASNFSVGYWTGGNIACTAMSVNIATPQMVLMNFDVAAGLTANYPARIFRPGTAEKLLFTAEL